VDIQRLLWYVLCKSYIGTFDICLLGTSLFVFSSSASYLPNYTHQPSLSLSHQLSHVQVQMKFILMPMEATFSMILYTFFTFMAIWSHCRAQFTNPGTIPRAYKAPFCKDERFGQKMTCRRTGVLKPPTAHYCREAKRVVLKMDHYCPWVNNVVGIFTQKYFLLFIFYTCLCTMFCGVRVFFLLSLSLSLYIYIYINASYHPLTYPHIHRYHCPTDS
jgi:hypothetical protein